MVTFLCQMAPMGTVSCHLARGIIAGLLLIKIFSPIGDAINGVENRREALGIKYVIG